MFIEQIRKKILQNHSAFIHSLTNHEEYDYEKKIHSDYGKKVLEKKCAEKQTRNKNKNRKKVGQGKFIGLNLLLFGSFLCDKNSFWGSLPPYIFFEKFEKITFFIF